MKQRGNSCSGPPTLYQDLSMCLECSKNSWELEPEASGKWVRPFELIVAEEKINSAFEAIKTQIKITGPLQKNEDK